MTRSEAALRIFCAWTSNPAIIPSEARLGEVRALLMRRAFDQAADFEAMPPGEPTPKHRAEVDELANQLALTQGCLGQVLDWYTDGTTGDSIPASLYELMCALAPSEPEPRRWQAAPAAGDQSYPFVYDWYPDDSLFPR